MGNNKLIEGLKMASDLYDKILDGVGMSENPMAKSPSMFLKIEDYEIYRGACKNYKESIDILIINLTTENEHGEQMKLVGYYDTEDLSIRFIADGIMYDYGVSNSPAWYEPDTNTTEIISCHIAGTKVNVSELPKNLQESLLKLSDWANFNEDY